MALRALHNLDETQLAALTPVWRALDVERRVYIANELVKLALLDLKLEFGPVFRLGLNDADLRVRAFCVAGVNEEEDPALIKPLLALLKDDPSDAVRAAAAQALGHFLLAGEMDRLAKSRHDQVYSALLRAIRRAPEDSFEYASALAAIGYADSPDVDFYLRGAVASEDPALQRAALLGMGRSGNHLYQPLVRAELLNVSPATRLEAARAAGELEDTDAVPELGQLIDDTDADVQHEALEALGKIGGNEARALIQATIASAEDELKSQAESALELFQALHGEFQFNDQVFDEEARTSFHAIRPAQIAAREAKRKPKTGD